ncbi:MAG: hypothetical protein Q7T04_03345 [Dehalococcoidia bacterium]|nr:hypothetical protein [Dehalococcoidia bacterium]
MFALTECPSCKSKAVHVGRMVRPGWLWVWVVISVGAYLFMCPVEIECRGCGYKGAGFS